MKSRLILITLFAGSLALAGCASGGPPKQAQTTPVSGSTSSPGAPSGANPALYNELPASARAHGITMATAATFGLPFATYATNGHTIIGMDASLAQALAKLIGVAITIQNVDLDEFIPGLVAHRYDFELSVTLDTKAREQIVSLVDYIKDGSGILVTSSYKGHVDSLSNICGMTVTATTGSLEQQNVQAQSKACVAAGKPSVQLHVFATKAQEFLALHSGRVQAVVGDALQMAWLVQQQNGFVRQEKAVWNAGIDGLAFPKGSPLVPIFQKALQELMNNGTYNAILSHYNLKSWELTKATVNAAPY
ncbi:MAG: transporter substrate-binding domain-containing protein [Nitrososphaerales archaeon]